LVPIKEYLEVYALASNHRSIMEDLEMQRHRIPDTNSKLALIPNAFFLSVFVAAVSLPVFTDAYAQDASRTSAGAPDSEKWVDVIRLDRLPNHRECPVVTAISVSPDGQRIAAAGDDHAIRIVEIATGKTITTLQGHLDWVQSVEFSPNGQLLASCGNDGSLRIWSLERAAALPSKHVVGHALLTLAFLNDSRVYAAGFGNQIYLWDAATNRMNIDHACDCRDIRTIAVSPDKKFIAYGGRDGLLRLRTTEARRTEATGHSHSDGEWTVPLHSERIRSLQFSNDGRRITSVGEDRRIVHFDLATRKILSQTEVGGGKLMGLCQLAPHLFAIAGSDNTIRIFNDVDQQVQAKLIGHDGSVSILKRTNRHLISGSFDTTIRIWDIEHSVSSIDARGRFVHPVAAQFEDSGAAGDVK